ncbi:hypothetical protein BABINDRAFT_163921 [Babjeviella inositovora NRRL Y-12698]|uniref:Uncharacterized protein n=1 Tax=Babjeviella inositovora NRRL Y-12698 TaxID=984486 RepID=A0A1E3QJ65_9ASCO|nr:uncharacterized protein BABINDRAFT_163921 [Babjeviella inositovora NRRL Y-12698]ODQ77027.1 hypothetical protein BABINDRAFT_163921 [Babjeviella inositovora NRRL Y-12698]
MNKPKNGTMEPNGSGAPPANDDPLNQATAKAWLAIGSFAETLGDVDKAAAAYDSVLRHDPVNAQALTQLASLYRSRDMFAKAAELYQAALNVAPEQGETWGLLGHCYLMLDDLQRAYTAYQQALYHLGNPNVPKLWHGIGILYDRYGSLEYAEEAFARVLELDPNFDKALEIYFRLGIIYKHQNKLQQALECFKYILPLPPSPLTQPDIWFQIGLVLEAQRDWLGAKDAYERVLQANPQHAKVLQQLGCLYAQGLTSFYNLDTSLKLLAQSLELDNADAHTWYHLGRVHISRLDYTAAYDAFQQAVNRDSRNPTFWCSIGVLYYQIAQYRDALDAYTRAIRLNPYISEVWYDLGTLYETCNNQITDALDAYRQAQRLDPSNPHIRNRLEQLIKLHNEGATHAPKPPVDQRPTLPEGMLPVNSGPPEMAQGMGMGHPQMLAPPLHFQQLQANGINNPPPPPPAIQHQQQPQLRALDAGYSHSYTTTTSVAPVAPLGALEAVPIPAVETAPVAEAAPVTEAAPVPSVAAAAVSVPASEVVPAKRELEDAQDSATKKASSDASKPRNFHDILSNSGQNTPEPATSVTPIPVPVSVAPVEAPTVPVKAPSPVEKEVKGDATVAESEATVPVADAPADPLSEFSKPNEASFVQELDERDELAEREEAKDVEAPLRNVEEDDNYEDDEDEVMKDAEVEKPAEEKAKPLENPGEEKTEAFTTADSTPVFESNEADAKMDGPEAVAEKEEQREEQKEEAAVAEEPKAEAKEKAETSTDAEGDVDMAEVEPEVAEEKNTEK